MRLLVDLYSIGVLFSKTSVSNVGRTLILNVLYLFCMLATVLGVWVIILGMSDNRVLLYMFYPMVGFGQLFFVCATLSVSTVWNSMAKKAAPILLAPVDNEIDLPDTLAPATNGTAATDKSSCSRATLCFCCYDLKKIPKVSMGVGAPVPTSLTALTVAVMISYFSPIYITAALSVCCLVIAISFAAAGGRLARLLTQSSEPVSRRQQQCWSLSCYKLNSNGILDSIAQSKTGTADNNGEVQMSIVDSSSSDSNSRNGASPNESYLREIEDFQRPGENQQSNTSSTAAVGSTSPGAEAETNSLGPARVPSSSLPTLPLPHLTPAHLHAHASPPPSSLSEDVHSQPMPSASLGVLQVAAQIRGTAHFIVG